MHWLCPTVSALPAVPPLLTLQTYTYSVQTLKDSSAAQSVPSGHAASDTQVASSHGMEVSVCGEKQVCRLLGEAVVGQQHSERHFQPYSSLSASSLSCLGKQCFILQTACTSHTHDPSGAPGPRVHG